MTSPHDPLFSENLINDAFVAKETSVMTDSDVSLSLTLSCDHSAAAEAFVTLATTDPYCMGAVVVARGLRRHGTTRSIVAMVTPNISQQSRWVCHVYDVMLYCASPSQFTELISIKTVTLKSDCLLHTVYSSSPYVTGFLLRPPLMRSSWWT